MNGSNRLLACDIIVIPDPDPFFFLREDLLLLFLSLFSLKVREILFFNACYKYIYIQVGQLYKEEEKKKKNF